jgi:Tfp pilus assembly protein PilN
MSQTETPYNPPAPEGGSKPSADRFASLNKALKEAEESLKRLAAEAKATAERSSAFVGAEKDAQRMRQWLRERSSNWSHVLKDLERDADKFAAEVAKDAKLLTLSATAKSATIRGLSEDTKRVAARIKGGSKPKS